jgi:mono/diheme cytochrome c family protein
MRFIVPWMILGCLAAAANAGDSADYTRDVKPLLAAHCVRCHGEKKPKAGLRLDTAAAIIKGNQDGPAVLAGNPEDSPLVLALLGEGAGERMPLKKPPLATDQIDAIRRWIAGGAAAPADETPSTPPSHWAFVPPLRPEPPAVADASWVRNPIDQFILARLESEHLKPSPEADRLTLIRRASLDLIGLPPTIEEVDAFLRDMNPGAYERMIDRLLASPHYGERWGRLWLDGARYADSNGYSIDAPRTIWPYRDWVVRALNADMPFDQFTIDQIAGDLRPGATIDQKVATGFHRNTPINQEGGIDIEQFRVESIIDRANTTATVWLGLTLGCAQCHDHKYDPLSQSEYYQFFAFFNNVDEPELPLATPDDVEREAAIRKSIDDYLAQLPTHDPSLWEKQKAWEDSLDMAGRQKQSQEVREAFDVVFDKRSETQRQTVFAAFVEQDAAMKPHRQKIAALKKSGPKIVTSMVVRERQNPRETHRFAGGDFTRPAEKVAPGVPSVLSPIRAESPDRMDLARWLVDPSNPLTARVKVNRLWQVAFGRGLVETDEDFGTQGTPPSHPELLDWLATELVEQGWSLKSINRLIYTSATYRQSSHVRAEDPENRLLARQSRHRIDAELVRDAALAASGLLNPEIGGPSVFPPQPDGVMNLGQMRREWKADEGPERFRRGLYTYFWRATPHPLFTLFDAPDGTRACTRRARSNTPLQALTLLNAEAFIECAEGLAGRLIEAGGGDDERLELAFRSCLARAPSDLERDRLRLLLTQARAEGQDERAAWTTLARVLMNLDEFITRE